MLRYFAEQIAPHHQLIFTSHSPFLVPANDLASVRTVEDVVTRDARDRKQSQGTKIRSDVLTTDPQTNFPIFARWDLKLRRLLSSVRTRCSSKGQAISLLAGGVCGVESGGTVAPCAAMGICPSGGIDKVLPFVRLFYGNKLNVAVLTDFERGQKRKLDELHKATHCLTMSALSSPPKLPKRKKPTLRTSLSLLCSSS